MTVVRVTYKPAQTSLDLPPGSKFKAMDAFLLSPQLGDPVNEATKDIATAATTLATAERFETGAYAASIEADEGEIVVVGGRPRVSGAVMAHGGSYPNAKDPETSIAAVVEWGNANAPGARILGRAGDPFHSARRVE